MFLLFKLHVICTFHPTSVARATSDSRPAVLSAHLMAAFSCVCVCTCVHACACVHVFPLELSF